MVILELAANGYGRSIRGVDRGSTARCLIALGILDYVAITWLSTGTPEGVMIAAKSLRSMVPARGFEPLAP